MINESKLYFNSIIITLMTILCSFTNVNSYNIVSLDSNIDLTNLIIKTEVWACSIKDTIPHVECKKDNLINTHEIMEVALTQWNYAHISGRRHNPEVVKYFKETGFDINNDDIAWCSAFINWCAIKSGYERTSKLNARSWSKIGTKVSKEDWTSGDVVVIQRGNKRSWKGHVGLYVRHDKNNIYLLGGNQSNKVRISKFKMNKVVSVSRLNKLNSGKSPSL